MGRILTHLWSKVTFKQVFQAVMIVVCATGLLVQCLDLIRQYSTGQTVVSIKYEDSKYIQIPGITVCYPEAISMEKLIEKFPQFKEVYDKYVNILEHMSAADTKNETLQDTLLDIYKFNVTHKFYKRMHIPAVQLYDLTFGANDVLPDLNTRVSLHGLVKFLNGSVISLQITDPNPIESIVFSDITQWNKCFTFFSHLNSTWRKYQMLVKDLTGYFYHSERWFPKEKMRTEGLKLAMHNPDEMPFLRADSFVDVKAYHFSEIAYNRWKTVLLGSKYKTNCRLYGPTDRHFYRMRSDCVKYCLNRKQNRCCHKLNTSNTSNTSTNKTCVECVGLSEALWTKDSFDEKPTLKVCHYGVVDPRQHTEYLCTQSPMFESNCQIECRPKCVNRYYNYEVKSVSKHGLLVDGYQDLTFVRMIHNQMPDQLTEHIPEMTFVQFISSIGGLVGMWLGLSVLSVFDYGFRSTLKKRSKLMNWPNTGRSRDVKDRH